jgi:hypothetical protein
MLKLAKQRERLALLEPGGSPQRPIEVESASQVEVHARALPCLRCEGTMIVDDHTAVTIESARLRVARMHCSACGATRAIYFRLAAIN